MEVFCIFFSAFFSFYVKLCIIEELVPKIKNSSSLLPWYSFLTLFFIIISLNYSKSWNVAFYFLNIPAMDYLTYDFQYPIVWGTIYDWTLWCCLWDESALIAYWVKDVLNIFIVIFIGVHVTFVDWSWLLLPVTYWRASDTIFTACKYR